MRGLGGLLALVVLAAACVLIAEPSGTRANHTGGMNAMSIDMEEEATPANTSSALGTRELCRRIDENNVMDGDEDVIDGLVIDITAKDVPPYDPNNNNGGIVAIPVSTSSTRPRTSPLKCNEYDNSAVNLLRRNSGSTLVDLSEPTPDDNSDDFWYSGVFDNNPLSTPEEGSGVLSRLTISFRAVCGQRCICADLGRRIGSCRWLL